ncbi:MFS transporter [Microbacterium sp.]|uniref:MFS transporter n=1 Tax=Microbacterium sp. TaxID=51671 RepID=UPI002735E75D|nr:MFS transporter [Microbacterium sp.]MDP3951256.1 MFS transporter [Microbacterium sp.]
MAQFTRRAKAAVAAAEERVPRVNVVLPSVSVDDASETDTSTRLRPLPWWGVALLIAATFGTGMAMIVPMAYSLAVRLEELAPGRTDALGYILGIGSAATLVLAPLTGVLSDRTRSRWGRRRPFTVIGMVIGVASIPVMTFAPNLVVLGLGWVLSTVGWGTTGASIGNWQADRLPAQQRGRVSGLAGLAMQTSPVIGIIVVSLVRSETFLVFLVPAAAAFIFVTLFLLFARDQDSRDFPVNGRLTVGSLLRSYTFRPREVPDFAWNWIGRFVFFLGLTLTTSFTVYFLSQRLELPVAEVATAQALMSALSIGTATLGAIGGGWLSDRMGRRKPFVLGGSILVGLGCSASAFAHDLPSILLGSLTMSLGIAMYSAVGQALLLDILPQRETQAGRYMSIALLAQKIPGVFAPLAAPLLLGVGGTQNFTLLYLVAAALTVAGGLFVMGIRSEN